MPAEQKLCACGCGQPVKQPTATWLTGHYSRVHHSKEKKERPLCKCGCGQHVKRLTHQYVQHHNPCTTPAKIEPIAALVLWNMGLNLRQIAENFPGSSRMAAQRAIKRAEAMGFAARPQLPNQAVGGIRYDKTCAH